MNPPTSRTDSASVAARLGALIDAGLQTQLAQGLKGLEKESLRLDAHDHIAQTPHPPALGSALTHPHITTDYSEALIELITPPFADFDATLKFLQEIHQFVHHHLGEEYLLAASMPCGIDGDDSVPIARYGTSNIGTMKHVYRRGLGYRYGRTMQAIAGVHFNYSLPSSVWPVLQAYQGDTRLLEDYVNDCYFGLIRNFLRQGWLLLYLFGASPALCRQFFKSRPHLLTAFEPFDAHTVYLPHATSLRMSDIGYKSTNQAQLSIDYNSLAGYVASLRHAIQTPFPEYETIGVKVAGEYRQLNANILQIENEFYSTIRPKQIAQSCEKPTTALALRGVRYVEIRSLDLDPFHPLGIAEETGRFLEAFLLTCLLQDSPPRADTEQQINNANQLAVANRGRQPDLLLKRGERTLSLQDWALEILETMQPVCRALDGDAPQRPYQTAWQQQYQRIADPEKTPSARLLQELRTHDQPFGAYLPQRSKYYQALLLALPFDDITRRQFEHLTEQSWAEQRRIEASDTVNFDDFLAWYFAKT